MYVYINLCAQLYIYIYIYLYLYIYIYIYVYLCVCGCLHGWFKIHFFLRLAWGLAGYMYNSKIVSKLCGHVIWKSCGPCMTSMRWWIECFKSSKVSSLNLPVVLFHAVVPWYTSWIDPSSSSQESTASLMSNWGADSSLAFAAMSTAHVTTVTICHNLPATSSCQVMGMVYWMWTNLRDAWKASACSLAMSTWMRFSNWRPFKPSATVCRCNKFCTLNCESFRDRHYQLCLSPRGKEYVLAFQMAMDKDHDFDALLKLCETPWATHSKAAKVLDCFMNLDPWLKFFLFACARRSTMLNLLTGH